MTGVAWPVEPSPSDGVLLPRPGPRRLSAYLQDSCSEKTKKKKKALQVAIDIDQNK